ncbi:hypothetical protein CPB97_010784 [Podila verticillata]|nr:hypothetical protein CPB97_010784 [Podila verticillata]
MLLLVPAQPLSARQEQGQKSHSQGQGKVLVLLPPSKNLTSDTVVSTSSLLPIAMEPADDLSGSIDTKFTVLPLLHDNNANIPSPDPNIMEPITPTRPGMFRHSSLPVRSMSPSRPMDRRASFHSRTVGRLSTGSSGLKTAFKRTLTVRSPLLTSVSSGVPVRMLETETDRLYIGAEAQDKRKRPSHGTGALKERTSTRRDQESQSSVHGINSKEESHQDKPAPTQNRSQKGEESLTSTFKQRDVAVTSMDGKQASRHTHSGEEEDGNDEEAEKSGDNVSCFTDENSTQYITLEMASLNVVLTPRQVQELHYQQRKQARRRRLHHPTTTQMTAFQSRRPSSSQAGHLFPAVSPPAAPLCPSAIPASYHIPLSAFRTAATVAAEEEARLSSTKIVVSDQP